MSHIRQPPKFLNIERATTKTVNKQVTDTHTPEIPRFYIKRIKNSISLKHFPDLK